MKKTEKNVEKPKVVKKRILPSKDLDLGVVATLASLKWNEIEWLVLLWITKGEFSEAVFQYNETLKTRKNSGTTKREVVKSMELLNAEIDDSLMYVKGYILEKFKKARAESMYGSFGIEHKNNSFTLPRDIDGRNSALLMMLTSISANGFDDKEYGLAYWTTIQKQYVLLSTISGELSGKISVKVGYKNQLKIKVKTVLKAIVNSVKANYPETWEEELRAWGFQKERY